LSDRQGVPEARLRRSRGVALVWLVPLAALAIVVWLGVRTLLERGPVVTITFETAEGLEAGRTKVRHKSVDVGTVESVKLADDLSKVVVTARMDRNVASHVTDGAKFWVVRPRLSPGGISGLNTIVSGSYIEMDPGGGGEPQGDFKGLEEPPIEQPTQSGKLFTLISKQSGSLGPGSPIYYRGIVVGEVLGSTLTDDGQSVHIQVYVRAPHDRLVHKLTRFWNASGISISAGTQGIKANVESLQALVAGGVAFDTATEGLDTPASQQGSEFHLFDDEAAARAEPLGDKILFQVNFQGVVRGLNTGSSVEMKGIGIGQVTDIHLAYNADTGILSTPATLEIDPSRLGLPDGLKPADGDVQGKFYDVLKRLIGEGLRARLATASLLTGQRIVSLEMVPDAAPAELRMDTPHPELPAVDGGDLDALMGTATGLMKSVHTLVEHVDKLVGGKEMQHTLASLDHVMANIDHLTSTDLPPLLKSLNQTADAATTALGSANHALGGPGQRDSELPGMLHELTEAARSVRSLADFLEEHPEALLQGKSGAGK